MRYFLDKIIPDDIGKETNNLLLICLIAAPVYLVWSFFDPRILIVYAMGALSATTLLSFVWAIKDVVINKKYEYTEGIILIFTIIMCAVLLVLFTIEFILK